MTASLRTRARGESGGTVEREHARAGCSRPAWRFGIDCESRVCEAPPRGSSRSAFQRVRGEAHAEALDETGDAGGVHLERVALAEVAEDRWVCLRDAAEIDELREEALEAG